MGKPPGTSRLDGRYLDAGLWVGLGATGNLVAEISELPSRLCRPFGAGDEGLDRAVEITARLRASTCARR